MFCDPVTKSIIHIPEIERDRFDKKKEAVKKLMYKIAGEAIEILQQGDLRKLDPLVGDTACHLRTIKLLKLHNTKELNKSRYVSLQTLLREGDDSLKLSDDESYLILSRLLTITRDPKDMKITRARNLKVIESEIPVELLDKIVFLAKARLSQLSIKYVVDQCEDKALRHMLLTNVKEDEKTHIQTSPCFFNALAVMKIAQRECFPIVFKIHHDHKTLKVCIQADQTGFFKKMPETSGKGAIVFEGESTFEGKSTQLMKSLFGNLKKEKRDCINPFPYSHSARIVLANAACHPQYPSTSNNDHYEKYLESIVTDPLDNDLAMLYRDVDDVFEENLQIEQKISGYIESYDSLKKKGVQRGFCRENTRFFAIQHVYLDIMEGDNSRVASQQLRS